MNKLRTAVWDDSDLFYELRKLSEAQPWYGGIKTTPKLHMTWFYERVQNVRLWVWEEDGVPQATIRVESNGELTFDAHIGANVDEMLRTFLKRRPARYKVTLDEGDPRVEHLERAGFQRFPATFLCFRP